VSRALRTRRPVRVVVPAMSSTITSCDTSGLPLQFMVMKLNRRCSILFHLLVPGGRWRTAISRPVSSASFWSSVFQRRVR